MEIELQEIRNFIADIIPFNLLPDETLDTLPEQLQIRYLRRGSAFPPQDSTDSFLYIVRSGAIDIRDNDNTLLNKLAENDYYSDCLTLELEKHHGETVEDTLLYQLPCQELATLRKANNEFDQHFSNSLSKRLKQAASRYQQPVDSGMAHMAVEVKQLIHRTPLLMPASSSIQAVAREMTEKQMSSALLTENEQLIGMITDRDLRRRCVATGMDVTLPVARIMTTDLHTIEDNTLALHALMTMTRMNVHHLPVVNGREIVGMLSATDITQHSSTNPAFIMSDIHKAQSLDELVGASKRLPELQVQLNNANASAVHIGDMISRITDAITVRLIEMAEQEIGPPPVPFVWVSGGSQARREQTSHSDQDNALIIADDMQPEDDAWFSQLARRVNDGLNECGFIYCPGDAMASNPQWRQPVKVWRQYFNDWINKPEPMSLMLSSIFFDLRPVYGERSLYEKLQQSTLTQTRDAGIFIAYMAANALTHRPPLGFFRRFVLIHDGEHNETFDIKHRGITPITDIARLLALSAGLTEINTSKRLRAASQTSALSHEMAENLEAAWSFISELRIQHQASQIRKGIPADNFLSPNKMSELDRKHLKDAFSVIQSMQDILERRYQTGRLG